MESRQKAAESMRRRWATSEYREKIAPIFSERQKRMWEDPEYRDNKVCRSGTPLAPEGTISETNGYLSVKASEHPLADKYGWVLEHRKVLYDKIGPGPHECHWSAQSGCGKTDLEWGGLLGLCVDHVDGDRGNNTPENVVPSCNGCNLHRHSGTNSARWANA